MTLPQQPPATEGIPPVTATTHNSRQQAGVSPLDMALNAAAAVNAYAERQAADPIRAHIEHTGEAGHQAAALAGNMALVSIARDVHQIAEDLRDLALYFQDPPPPGREEHQ